MGLNKELDAKHKEILNDIKKNLADVSKDSNLFNSEMTMAISMLHEKSLKGKFEYIFEKGHVSMQVNMSKYLLIQMITEIAESVFEDKYELISKLLAYSIVAEFVQKKGEEITVDCNGKTQAEIDLIKEMFKKSPEELEKLKEQLYE